MGEFFQGWRRKAGLLALLMALAAMAGWVRSEAVYDGIIFDAPEWSCRFASLRGLLVFIQTSPKPQFVQDLRMVHDCVQLGRDRSEPFHPIVFSETDLRWDWSQFHFAIGASDAPGVGGGGSGERLYELMFSWEWGLIAVVPYWSVTVPSTFISLWLLLSKPRKSTQKKITEPLNEKVK